MRRLGRWVEHDHPRDQDGKFTSGGRGGGSSASSPSWGGGWKSGPAAYTPKHRKTDADRPPSTAAPKAAAKASWPKPASKTSAKAKPTDAKPAAKPTRKSRSKPPQSKPAESKRNTTPAASRSAKPAAATQYHRNLDGIEDLARDVEDGFPPRERRSLTGGVSAETELLTLKNGRKVVYKSGGNPDAEQLASKMANALGLRAPRVYRKDDSSVYMDYVEDAVTAGELEQLDPDEWWRRRRLMSDHSDGEVIGLLDQLVGNVDRNTGNWMLTAEGRTVPIDHGHAFGEVPTTGRPSFQPVTFGFAELYEPGKPNPLSADDVKEVRRRLEGLRDDFRHLNREQWLDYSLTALDALAPDASNPWNQIAGVR